MTANHPDRRTFVEIYKKMTLVRPERRAALLCNQVGSVVMPYYSTRGQEVIPSAILVSLTDEDYICPIYRGTHDSLAKGMPIKQLWAELAGRVSGSCKDKGGRCTSQTSPRFGATSIATSYRHE